MRKLRRGSRRGFTLLELTIVILVMGIMMTVILSIARSFSMLRTSKDEAQNLAEVYTFARRAAIKSGETVFLGLDLDAETYSLYRIDRTKPKIEKRPILEERNLSSANSLVAVISSIGGRHETGHVDLPFFPDGTTEEASIFIGPSPDVKQTVFFPRFAVSARVEPGEVLPESMPDADTLADEKLLLDKEAR